MTPARTIPVNSKHDVVSYDIIIDGQVVDPGLQILSISILKEANKIPTAKIIVRDGDAAEENFEISEQDVFVPGKSIEIKIGRDRRNDTLFKGIIIKHSLKISENGQTELRVEAKDETIKMTIGRHSRYFEEQKDSAVIEEIAGEYGLQREVETTSLQHKELVQHHSTDWDFVLSRADVNGMLVMVDDGKLIVKKPEVKGSADLDLLYGATILSLEAEIDARTQWSKVEARSWDYTNQDLFTADTTSASFSEHGNIDGQTLSKTIDLEKFELMHSGQAIEEELRQWVDACMIKSRLAKIRGQAKFEIGYGAIKPGDTLGLHGLGDRFNGNAFVTGIRQDIANGEWYTHVQFGLKPDWFACREEIVDYTAGGLLPGVNGLQIGKVVQLEGDPDGEDRILVKVPVIDNQANGIWMRVASLDAGENRGAYFRPEIDDEVIVGFINDDPRDGVVLGMLHSSAKPAPITAEDVNHEKGFVTRSEMRLIFNDEKSIITIETPGGQKITISDEDKGIKLEDQTGNSITLNDKGIDLNSPKDIKLTATGKIEIKAQQDLTAEGLNVNLKANAQLKAEGQAGAELSTSAIATVKGSLVQIN